MRRDTRGHGSACANWAPTVSQTRHGTVRLFSHLHHLLWGVSLTPALQTSVPSPQLCSGSLMSLSQGAGAFLSLFICLFHQTGVSWKSSPGVFNVFMSQAAGIPQVLREFGFKKGGLAAYELMDAWVPGEASVGRAQSLRRSRPEGLERPLPMPT